MIETITRQQLLEVAEMTLTTAGIDPEDQLAIDVREVAKTARRMAGGCAWWIEEEECGCLVGTILKGPPEIDLDHCIPTSEYRAGDEYMTALHKIVGSFTERARVLTVIDEREAA